MQAMQARRPMCANCGAPMDVVDAVAVLASVEGHSIFECEWCGHIALVPDREGLPSADWLDPKPCEGRRGVRYTPLLSRA